MSQPTRDLLFADVPDECARWAVERLRPEREGVRGATEAGVTCEVAEESRAQG